MRQRTSLGSNRRVLDLKQDSQGVEFVRSQRNLITVDVCRDESQEKFEIGLHKVQDDLVIVVHIVHFRDLRSW